MPTGSETIQLQPANHLPVHVNCTVVAKKQQATDQAKAAGHRRGFAAEVESFPNLSA